MKSLLPVRSALLAGLFSLAASGVTFAQSPSPSATTIPPSKPATETATPSPGAPVNTSTPAEKSGGSVRKDLLEKYDKNHDGVLDASERSAFDKERASRKTERLQKYDKNHDGKLDDSEKAAMRADRKGDKKAGADKEKASPTP